MEDSFGYVVHADGGLWANSLRPNFVHRKPVWFVGLPSPFTVDAKRSAEPAEVQFFDEIVSTRHLWEWNYYHFLMDVVPQLLVLERAGIDSSLPLAIGRYPLDLPWVTEILGMGELADRTWVVQDGFLIESEHLSGCKVTASYVDRMRFVQRVLASPAPNPSAARRVFLVRAKGSSRSLRNHDEAVGLLEDHGFEAIDTAKMTVVEQQGLFAETRFLVALHGAGLANVTFRYPAPLSILELHGHSYVARIFQTMAKDAGWYFDRLSGASETGDNRSSQFTIDIPSLHASVVALLEH